MYIDGRSISLEKLCFRTLVLNTVVLSLIKMALLHYERLSSRWGYNTKYICFAYDKMVALAKAHNAEHKYDPWYPDVENAKPRHYEFFRWHLLKPFIHYREERNVKRCHYCMDYMAAKDDFTNLLRRRDHMSLESFDNEMDAVQLRIKKGEAHDARWKRQNGFSWQLKHNARPDDECLIETDYFSFYTVTAKVNVLALVSPLLLRLQRCFCV